LGSTDRGLLDRLAETTGGAELSEPVAAFASQVREIWGTLLLLVVILFLLDVALRRVTGWLGDRQPSRQLTSDSAEPWTAGALNREARARTTAC
jgi:hypothetical protein